jgi:hypothetical protein
MKHEHLPALNKYTSPNQYAALQEVASEGSLFSLLTQGRMGTTIGALIRSAWIDSEVIKNDEGVTSERWYVTDAGKHAMQLYEIKREQEKQKAEAEAECRRIRDEQKQQQVALEREALELLDQYYKRVKAMKQELEVDWKKITTVAAKGSIDQYKWPRMIALAKERNGMNESSRSNGGWVKTTHVRDDDW